MDSSPAPTLKYAGIMTSGVDLNLSYSKEGNRMAYVAYLCNGTVVSFTQNDTLIPSYCCPCNAGCNANSTCDALAGSNQGNPFIPAWYIQLLYIVAFASMVLVAAGGNIIVVWIVLAHKRMRTVTNYFLVNLAVADALISIFNTLFNFLYMLKSDWPFGGNYCRFSQFIAPFTISASVFTFMAIAIDR